MMYMFTKQHYVHTLTDPVDVSTTIKQSVGFLFSAIVIVALPTLLVCGFGAHHMFTVINHCASYKQILRT